MTEIYYTKDHEWIKIDGNVGVVGITAYASEQLGDIVFVELPEDGKIAEIGKDIAILNFDKKLVVDANTTLFDTLVILQKQTASAVAISKNNKLAGIFTVGDLNRLIKGRKKFNYNDKIIEKHSISILKAYIILDNLHMKNIFIKITDLFKNLLNRNLHSKDPNLFLFDLYRLNYLCKIKNA